MGDWLRELIERDCVVEREGWAAERVARVTRRLQAGEAERFETLVLWLDSHSAFTAPGRTIYFSRRLLERMPDDDAAALVIAHEIAHHRLGHVPDLSQRWHVVPVQVVLAMASKWITSQRRERDADLLAIEMCIQAGFDVERCMVAFEILDHIVLDYGDVDSSLGTEDGASRGSHPAVRRRIEMLRAHAAAYQRGHRLDHELAERRRERRRRLTWVGGATAAVGLFMLTRGRR